LPQLDLRRPFRQVDDQDGPEALLPLRAVFFRAASLFKRLTTLKLHDVIFWRFGDFLRLVSAFPCLNTLALFNISWTGGEQHRLADEACIKSLRLWEITVSSEDVSAYKDFLVASNVLRYCRKLMLHVAQHICASASVPKYAVTVDMSGSAIRSLGLDQGVPPDLAALARRSYQACIRLNQHLCTAEWLQTCFSLLEDIFASLCAPALHEVEVEPDRGYGVDETVISVYANPLPTLRLPDQIFKIEKLDLASCEPA